MALTGQSPDVEKLETLKSKLPIFPAFHFTFLAFVISITISISIIGCTSVKPGPNEPEVTQPETNEIEITEPEPNEIQTPGPEPNTPEITKPEANEVRIPEPAPNDTEPPKTEPNAVETPKIGPNTVDANEISPEPNVSFHDKCAYILTTFVDDDGMVNYKMLKRKRGKLSRLLIEFANLDSNEYKSWSKEDKIAFWINAYNMQTLRIIVANYPINSYRFLHPFPGWGPHSIQHISKRIGGIHKQKFTILKEEFTLERIEQRFFYKEFDEPRVFFALLSYPTLSNPPLRNEPYYGRKLDEQLNDQAKKFLSRPHGFTIDRKKRRVYLAPMLKPIYHGRQFINKYRTDKKFKDQPLAIRAVLNCLTNYISKQDTFFLETENYKVKYIRYDWRINDSSIKK